MQYWIYDNQSDTEMIYNGNKNLDMHVLAWYQPTSQNYLKKRCL